MKKKTSPIWDVSKEEFVEMIEKSNTMSEVLDYFDLKNKGSNYKTIVARAKSESISLDKLRERSKKYQADFIKSVNKKRKASLEEVLIIDSDYNRSNLKKRLINDGILENKCSECGQLPEWKGKSLVMVLDHINGKSNDNRKENLRLLCPNCNSQTLTFSGRNNKKNRDDKKCICGKILWKGNESGKCKKCTAIVLGQKARKVERPSKEELEKMVWEKPTDKIGKDYGVSGNAIAKWCKRYNINKPPRGYWAKVYIGK